MSLCPSVRVALWTTPRCCGTAFERCISQSKKIKIFTEPYLAPYYFGENRVTNRFATENKTRNAENIGSNWKIYAAEKTVGDITYDLIKDYSEYEAVFIHDHAYHIVNDQHFMPKSVINMFKNTFMLRNPVYQIKSWYRCQTNPDVFGEFAYFDPEWLGWKEMYKLFEFVTNELKQKAIVFDADDLMKDREILKMYCDATGLEYTDSMINWSDEIDGVWNKSVPSLHGELKQSKTFRTANIEYDCEYPQIVFECIEKAMPYYEELSKYKLQMTAK
eukprot:394129_1